MDGLPAFASAFLPAIESLLGFCGGRNDENDEDCHEVTEIRPIAVGGRRGELEFAVV